MWIFFLFLFLCLLICGLSHFCYYFEWFSFFCSVWYKLLVGYIYIPLICCVWFIYNLAWMKQLFTHFFPPYRWKIAVYTWQKALNLVIHLCSICVKRKSTIWFFIENKRNAQINIMSKVLHSQYTLNLLKSGFWFTQFFIYFMLLQNLFHIRWVKLTNAFRS